MANINDMSVRDLRALVAGRGIRRGLEVALARRDQLIAWLAAAGITDDGRAELPGFGGAGGAAAPSPASDDDEGEGVAAAAASPVAAAAVPTPAPVATLNSATVAAAVRPAAVRPAAAVGGGDMAAALAAAVAGIAAAVRPAADAVDVAAVEKIVDAKLSVVGESVAAVNAALGELRAAVEAVATQKASRRVIEVRGPAGAVELGEYVHPAFEDVLQITAIGKPCLMVGPRGTGKTNLASQVARALKLDFGFVSLSAGVTENKIIGSLLPVDGGKIEFVPGQFAKIYENGGVFLFDEIDNADPNVLVFLNAALANGALSIPGAGGRVLKRHPKCHILAAANTFGTGPNAEYCGRNRLDASTLDRFAASTVVVDYDHDLEVKIVEGYLGHGSELAANLLNEAKSVRAAIKMHGFQRELSTRFIADCAEMMAAGRPMSKMMDSFFSSWSKNELKKIGR